MLGQKKTQEAEISAREENLREQRRRLTECQQQRGTLEVELAQKNMSVQNLRERIQQKYHLNLDDIRSECITITFADEGPAKVQTLDAGGNGGERRGDRLGRGGANRSRRCRNASMKWAR